MVIRIIPYPPSLRSTAARTMDPAIGASTWAFGSHRWRPYRGILTMNAIMHASHSRVLDQEFGKGCAQYCMIKRLRVPKLFWSHSKAIRRGKEPTRV